jgi:hypothetical protein
VPRYTASSFTHAQTPSRVAPSVQKVRHSSSVQNMQIRDSVFRENLCVGNKLFCIYDTGSECNRWFRQLTLSSVRLACWAARSRLLGQKCHYDSRRERVRASVTIGYFAICFAVLSYYTYDNDFCSRPGESGHAVQTLHLTIACTLWGVLVSICGAFAAKKFAIRGLAPMVSTVLALVGFASIPFWMYDRGIHV